MKREATLTPAQMASSLRNRADYFQSAEGGWRDDSAALLNEAADTIDSLASELERVRKENADLRDDAKRLHTDKMRLYEAGLWALGEWGDFPAREEGDGAYWWRKEFRERSGIVFHPPIDGEVLPLPPQAKGE